MDFPERFFGRAAAVMPDYRGNNPLVPKCGTCYFDSMQVIAKRTLKQFWVRHPEAEVPLRNWYAVVDKAIWCKPADVKAVFGATVDFIEDNRLIFDIAGNKYRLVVHVAYRFKRVLVKFVGTHKEYDRIKAGSV